MNKFFADVRNDLDKYYEQLVAILPKLVICLLVLVILLPIFLFFLKRIRPYIENRSEDKLLSRFLIRVVKTLFIIILLIIIFKIMGFHGLAAGLWGTAGVGAFILGFALKDIFEHFLAGFLLAFSRPFRIGDTVELDGNKGTVMALNMRNTHIKSFDGQDVYIPNGNIIKHALKNYTIDGYLRFDYALPLEFGSDIDQAIGIVLEELSRIPGILVDAKKPFVTLDEVRSRHISLGVFYWVDLFEEEANIDSLKIHAVGNVVKALEKAGFHIPGDYYEIHQSQIIEKAKD